MDKRFYNTEMPRDAVDRLLVSRHQNIFEADFEYGSQPLRWENLVAGSATITHLPGEGGVRMRLTTGATDLTIRQSRPYHRYQPGKTMFMATAVNFGATQANQVQRVGIFDDSNGIFFEQSGTPTAENPYGVFFVVRSDAGGVPTDSRVPITACLGAEDPEIVKSLKWDRIQMIWMEYAWYGAGCLRWGVYIDGSRYLLHRIGYGNLLGQTKPWSRTGNLPVRYEQRNTGVTAAPNDMTHYGVSVIVEGGIDDQRGFTYSYGMALQTPQRNIPSNTARFPILSIRPRTMGTIETTQAANACTGGSTTTLQVGGSPWTAGQWVGRSLFLPGLGGGNGLVARITGNTVNTLTFGDVVTGLPLGTAVAASQAYQIGLINRGLLLPLRLMVSSSALAQCELISSTPTTPITLTGPVWQGGAALNQSNSLVERDVSASAMSGGETVMKFTLPAGGSGLQDLDLSNLFPLYNNIRGNNPDMLVVAISTAGASANVGADLIGQEAMS